MKFCSVARNFEFLISRGIQLPRRSLNFKNFPMHFPISSWELSCIPFLRKYQFFINFPDAPKNRYSFLIVANKAKILPNLKFSLDETDEKLSKLEKGIYYFGDKFWKSFFYLLVCNESFIARSLGSMDYILNSFQVLHTNKTLSWY